MTSRHPALCLIMMFLPVGLGAGEAAAPTGPAIPPPVVNQIGYNLGEAKRFVVPKIADGTPFAIHLAAGGAAVFTGKIVGQAGDFTTFDPAGSAEFVVDVPGAGRSHPFVIADHALERAASAFAYQFFIDVRVSTDPLKPLIKAPVAPGKALTEGYGPSRDGAGYTLELPFIALFYAANPALFDRWTNELGPKDSPDILDLMCWHAEFCANAFPLTNDPNNLDQLAAVLASYHAFLKPRLPEADYQRYRALCLESWDKAGRERVMRNGKAKLIAKFKQRYPNMVEEYGEQLTVPGQCIIRNLFMWLSERAEKDGDPKRFLANACREAEVMVREWDPAGNPAHSWILRNSEHVPPQALALLLMLAPEQAPPGTREKLAAWRDYMLTRTKNMWHYRTHSDQEWALDGMKEIGPVAGLGGAMFLVAHVLGDKGLRAHGWSYVNFVFGCNPARAVCTNVSPERKKTGLVWKGIEVGWPHGHPHGIGKLGLCRGVVEGTPANEAFPYNPAYEGGGGPWGCEGWAITNRAWMATVTFAQIGSQHIAWVSPGSSKPITRAKPGERVGIELRAALNQDPTAIETGWVEVIGDNGAATRVTVTETGPDTGMFHGTTTVGSTVGKKLMVSYGYWASQMSARLEIGQP
ncbi:MAG: hypothetical protein AAB263_20735 [Planctomycetota bacterium]